MKSTRLILAVFACTLIWLPAQAEEQGACRADVQKFCKDVTPGGGAVARCLKRNESGLSSACRARMAEGRQRAEEFAEVCRPDAEKFCKQVQPGDGRVLRCLAANKDQLSAPCREKMAQAEKSHPCMADIERLCKNVQPGEGRIDQCLRQQQGKLAGACKAALARAGKGRE